MQESFDCCGITFGREQEINGLSGGIRSSIEIPVLPLHLYVNFIDAVSSERGSGYPVPARRFVTSAGCNRSE
jgi:hypothetical protein